MRFSKALVASMCCVLLAVAASSALAETTVSADITEDTAWLAAAGPFILTQDITVSTGATLTIGLGAEVRMRNITSDDLELVVEGGLIATGTSEAPIRFLAESDTTPGSWESIRFVAGSTCNLRYLEILHSDFGLELASPTAESHQISDITIGEFRSRGISATGSGALELSSLDINGGGLT